MHRKKNAMEYNIEDSYQVIATNIKWDSHARSAAAKRLNQDDLPEQMSLDIPAGVSTTCSTGSSAEKSTTARSGCRFEMVNKSLAFWYDA